MGFEHDVSKRFHLIIVDNLHHDIIEHHQCAYSSVDRYRGEAAAPDGFVPLVRYLRRVRFHP